VDVRLVLHEIVGHASSPGCSVGDNSASTIVQPPPARINLIDKGRGEALGVVGWPDPKKPSAASAPKAGGSSVVPPQEVVRLEASNVVVKKSLGDVRF
jgi:hypothetical protein